MPAASPMVLTTAKTRWPTASRQSEGRRDLRRVGHHLPHPRSETSPAAAHLCRDRALFGPLLRRPAWSPGGSDPPGHRRQARGGPRRARARRCPQGSHLLSGCFSWAMRRGLVEANPAIGTEAEPERPRDRVLNVAELRAVWQACAGLGDFGVVRILLLTGQRRTEVAGLRCLRSNSTRRYGCCQHGVRRTGASMRCHCAGKRWP